MNRQNLVKFEQIVHFVVKIAQIQLKQQKGFASHNHNYASDWNDFIMYRYLNVTLFQNSILIFKLALVLFIFNVF